MTTPCDLITSHPNYNQDDFDYLTAKGWTQHQILTRWTQEHAAGQGPCDWSNARGKFAAYTGRNTGEPT